MTLVRLTLQSVLARPRSWVVGLLAAGAAVLLTPGLALVESISEGTRRSLIESGTGDLQVYHSGSTGVPLMLVGPSGEAELTPLEDYPAAEAALRSVEGIQEVVPLEVGMGAVFRGNYLDEKLAAVRAVLREPSSEARDARLALRVADLRRTLERVARDEGNREQAFAAEAAYKEDREALERIVSADFWERFSAEPLPALELIENRVARLAGEGESVSLDYLGTDLTRFAGAFPRFELLSGQMPPPGSRGLLLGHAAYEQFFKLPIAFRLDELHRALERGARLADDEGLRTQVERNQAELPDLLSRLDAERGAALQSALARALGHPGELEALLKEFLTLDDGNFDARYKLFYAELAPHLPLYRIQPGETLSLRNPMKLGSNVPVKVWGTFRFRGLGGDSSRVNTTSLVDLVTSRQLANRPTRAELAEARRLIDELGMGDAGAPATDEPLGTLTIVDAEPVKASGGELVVEREVLADTFTDEEMKDGSVLQAAIVLKPGAVPEEVTARIQQLAGEKKLPLATVSWQEAGGFVSGVVGMGQVLLFLLALMLGGFVLLLSTGTLLLLAKERIGEVGTLRAIGMHRRDVFFSLLLEGLLLGGVGSLLGAVAGAALLSAAVGQGISVSDESLQFFLGGPVLYPQLKAWHGGLVVVGMMWVVAWASLVPAWRGSAVEPVVAMSRRGD
ncbi:FtsX-like permease family protein [Archangium violaceum]|uniref:FtsX-like permease family protein n=1 Tax=Archangium violaceum TaxID=83451 RepID=UPI002B30C718|nr:FtsX-like permease family protein [Archangium gephyra]